MVSRSTILSFLGASAALISATGPVFAQSGQSRDEHAWLRAHNDARQDFGTRPLRWSAKLSEEAREWAQYLARTNTMRHSPQGERSRTGENLWMGTAGYFAPKRMIGYFVDERRYFRAGYFPQVSSTGNWADVGHFTQIVWAETREVGCAKASNGHNDFLVCRYYPAGNVVGDRIEPRRHMAQR